MNSATENSTTSTRIETRTSLDQELLLKVLSNPEMAILLTILSRQLPVDKDDENRNSPLGAKNNDSTSEKWVIVKFYTVEYRKCGNSNSKNDSRPCLGASALLKSVDFTAFAVNVKTIAPKKYLYQSGHAIWYGGAPNVVNTFVKGYDLSGKKIAIFATSGGSGIGKTAKKLAPYVSDTAEIVDAKLFNGSVGAEKLKVWIDSLL